jgi:phage host-nuclease inhibitor protein Gam
MQRHIGVERHARAARAGHLTIKLMKTQKHRIKLETSQITTRAEMEALIGQICECQLEHNELTTELDLQITSLRKEYEGDLDKLACEIQARTELAKAWADAHPEEFPDKKKSIDFVHATIGFRTGTPKVIQKKSYTVKKVLELLAKFTWSKKYIRLEPSIDKESILADRKTLTEDQLKSVGLKIDQAETFYIDLKATQTETRIVGSSVTLAPAA